jgi:hypothetical protein
MEVLDNLPHDKIRAKTPKRIEQAMVVRSLRNDTTATTTTNDNNNPHHTRDEEVFVPLTDPLLQRIVRKVPTYVQPYPCWVPSVACGVIHHLIQQRSRLSLALADFDWLPAPDLDLSSSSSSSSYGSSGTDLRHKKSEVAEGEPIVTDMDGTDHECYLIAPSHCDILFPTDFDKLASFTKRCLKVASSSSSSSSSTSSARHVRVEKQSDFLQRWGPEHVQKTNSLLFGFLGTRHNPLLHDFINCSVLTISHNDNDNNNDNDNKNRKS